jgi:hypothetical membrane protein
MSRSRLLVLAAAAMLLAGLVYLSAEVVVASAWTNPPYDWANNLVPDLGNTACGPYQDRVVCSPRNGLMNAGFVAQGVLFGLAAIALARLVAGWARGALVALGLAHAAGLTLVAIFHQSPTAAQDGTLIPNFAGAGVAILAGNAILIVAGAQWGALRLPRWFGRASVALGSVAIVAGVLLFVLNIAPPGVRERASIYPFIAWQIVSSPILLRASGRPS